MSHRSHPTKQRGVSTITAIFLVTVLASLAAAGLQMWRSAQDDQTLDMQSIRARYVARAGLQIGFWRVTNVAAYCAGVAPVVLNFGTPGAAGPDLPQSMAPYRVTLTCTREDYTDGGNVYRHTLTAVACNKTTGCPDNAAALQNRYVEAVAYGECVVKAAAYDCRETR